MTLPRLLNIDPERSRRNLQAGYVPVKALIVMMDPPYLSIPCQFNPARITFSHSSKWNETALSGSDESHKDFAGGESAKLDMELFFDTTSVPRMDVRIYTDPLVSMTMRNPITKRPPRVRFVWGMFAASPLGIAAAIAGKVFTTAFKGYLNGVSVKFTMFLPDGTPTRAEADVSFISDERLELPFTNPTSRSEARQVWTVTEGQTLDWIAHRVYGNASAWRRIAEANNLEDPRALRNGQVLRLPPLED